MQQKIDQSTDVLKAIISPVMHEGDVQWPPRGPDTLKLMEKVWSHLYPIVLCFLHPLLAYLAWSLHLHCKT